MTNRNMVKTGQGAQNNSADQRARPEPNPAAPTPVPAPESDSQLFVKHDPMDSPQLKPNIKQDRTKGLKAE